MRTGRVVIASMAWLLTVIAPLRAGVYFPADPRPWPLPEPGRYYPYLLELQGAAVNDRGERMVVGLLGSLTAPYAQALHPATLQYDVESEVASLSNSLGGRMRTEVARLETREKAGRLTLEDRINLGGYYALIANPRAESVLSSALTLSPNNFMVTASLATVYLGRGDSYDVAIRFQMLTLDNWPRVYPGWSSERLRWHRRVELLTLDLMQKRKRDRQQPRRPPDGGFGRTGEVLDDLFPGVRFVGPGTYRPGEIAPRLYDKLPPDAVAVVGQILMSVPHDPHLQWLLAELFNAHGEVYRAHHLLYKLDQARFHGEGLRQHMLILEGPAKVEMAFKPEMRQRLLFELALPGARFASEAGSGAWEASRIEVIPPFKENPTPKDTVDDISWLPSWKTLAVVGFPAGLFLGMLIVLQLRQIRRRSPAALHRPPAAAPQAAKEATP